MRTLKLNGCLIGAIAFMAINSSVYAASFPEKHGYVTDERGNVVRNSYGDCWRTGYWTPAMAIEECDPGLVKKDEPKAAGSTPAAPPAAARATEPAPAPAPAAATMPAAAPEKPAVKAYFKAEALFDFDKAVVRKEGKKTLDEEIVAGMKAHPEVKSLIVTGHTDRIGSEAYNQKLSERRANAVKAYLAENGVGTERIKVAGKGESEPHPQANTGQACKGVRGKKLIACLQPDRRVTIESENR